MNGNIMEEQKSFPVKYMPICRENPYNQIWCEVLDTTTGFPACFTWLGYVYAPN